MSATRAYYDTFARTYDEVAAGDAWTPNQYLAADLAGTTRRPQRILDLGAGTGQTCETLAALYGDAGITAVDFSSKMLTHLSQKAPGATRIVADIASFVATNTVEYDLVAAIGCLEFVPYLHRVLPRIVECVRPGGTLCFTYEPQIGGSLSQGRRRSAARSRFATRGPVTTYRHSVGSIYNELAKRGTVHTSELFVSYEFESTPVIYHYIRLETA